MDGADLQLPRPSITQSCKLAKHQPLFKLPTNEDNPKTDFINT